MAAARGRHRRQPLQHVIYELTFSFARALYLKYPSFLFCLSAYGPLHFLPFQPLQLNSLFLPPFLHFIWAFDISYMCILRTVYLSGLCLFLVCLCARLLILMVLLFGGGGGGWTPAWDCPTAIQPSMPSCAHLSKHLL